MSPLDLSGELHHPTPPELQCGGIFCTVSFILACLIRKKFMVDLWQVAAEVGVKQSPRANIPMTQRPEACLVLVIDKIV